MSKNNFKVGEIYVVTKPLLPSDSVGDTFQVIETHDKWVVVQWSVYTKYPNCVGQIDSLYRSEWLSMAGLKKITKYTLKEVIKEMSK